MDLGSAARDETEEFSMPIRGVRTNSMIRKVGESSPTNEGGRIHRGLVTPPQSDTSTSASVEQTERIEYFLGFPDAALLRPLFRHRFLTQRKGRTRRQWEHALMLARARVSDDFPLTVGSCRLELTPRPCLERRRISDRSAFAGREEPSGWVIDYFPRKSATVVVHAPAISAWRYYRARFAAAH